MSLSGTETGKNAEKPATDEVVGEKNDAKMIEEKIAEDIDKNISGTYKGEKYSITMEESSQPDKFDAKIVLDAERFYETAWAGVATTEGIMLQRNLIE